MAPSKAPVGLWRVVPSEQPRKPELAPREDTCAGGAGDGHGAAPAAARRASPLSPERPGNRNRALVVVGPCAVLPRAILQWNVGSHRDISLQSLALFRLLEPRIEILVLGTGDRVEQLHPTVLRQMRLCGIAVEVQDTPNACATFNFLTSEKRLTAAGLIPPRGTYTGLPVLPSATD
uniref:NADH dehydrogenase [ubiquinone] 1 alpha subcomplex assembly factor 3 n=1 Tax=Meleagris gallopavo TaxID=9103 RepID=A0A803YFC7_MELGA